MLLIKILQGYLQLWMPLQKKSQCQNIKKLEKVEKVVAVKIVPTGVGMGGGALSFYRPSTPPIVLFSLWECILLF